MQQSSEFNKKSLFSVEKEQEVCPMCSGKLVMKSGQHGPFLGCENYPKCDFVRALKPHNESSLIRVIPEKQCPLCDANLAIKQGRFGMFIGCSNFPECDYIANSSNIANSANEGTSQNLAEASNSNAIQDGDVIESSDEFNSPQPNTFDCPVCKTGQLIQRKSRYGKTFWGCNQYPECKFLVNDTPVVKPCPSCGFALMTFKADRQASNPQIYKCANKRCGHKIKMPQTPKNVTEPNLISIEQIIDVLKQGRVISYPTEAVFGLGCDPDNESAVHTLCLLKERPISKGLILVASGFEQLIPYVDTAQLTSEHFIKLNESWPGPFTWVMPANPNTPKWLTGDFDSIAVRVSAHLIIQEICTLYGKPIVSTSANLSGQPPAKNTEQVFTQFGQSVLIVEGKIGEQATPTEIRDILTGKLLRA